MFKLRPDQRCPDHRTLSDLPTPCRCRPCGSERLISLKRSWFNDVTWILNRLPVCGCIWNLISALSILGKEVFDCSSICHLNTQLWIANNDLLKISNPCCWDFINRFSPKSFIVIPMQCGHQIPSAWLQTKSMTSFKDTLLQSGVVPGQPWPWRRLEPDVSRLLRWLKICHESPCLEDQF